MSPDTWDKSVVTHLHHPSDDPDLLISPAGHLRRVYQRNGLRHDSCVVANARGRRAVALRLTPRHVVPRGRRGVRALALEPLAMKWGGSLARLRPCAVYGRPLAFVMQVPVTRGYSSSSLMQRIMQPWQNKFQAWVEKTKPVASSRLSELSHRWNDYSGYAEIHALKDQVQLHGMYTLPYVSESTPGAPRREGTRQASVYRGCGGALFLAAQSQ